MRFGAVVRAYQSQMAPSLLSLVHDASETLRRRLVLLRLPQIPIVQQLLLEEALYRTSKSIASIGWVLYNDYTTSSGHSPFSSQPYNIVLGRSQKPHDMVCTSTVVKDSVPLIRRYSVGGASRPLDLQS